MGFFNFGKPDIEKLYNKKDIRGLIKALKNRDEKIRAEAAMNLRLLDDTIANNNLINYLYDHNREVQFAAIISLSKIGGSIALDGLINLFRKGNIAPRNHYEATSQLAKLDDPRAIDTLVAFFEKKEFEQFALNEYVIDLFLKNNDNRLLNIIMIHRDKHERICYSNDGVVSLEKILGEYSYKEYSLDDVGRKAISYIRSEISRFKKWDERDKWEAHLGKIVWYEKPVSTYFVDLDLDRYLEGMPIMKESDHYDYAIGLGTKSAKHEGARSYICRKVKDVLGIAMLQVKERYLFKECFARVLKEAFSFQILFIKGGIEMATEYVIVRKDSINYVFYEGVI